ncbi:DGQHR domain-containing protein [Aquimarina aggregata]|uniref:DGQHR domain-containing protein n=1 Tax=Aquimarina aggregata TaxID=1642818 RepID=UPI0024908B2D|nr:DGQHR domain-containing protein [Aquimarina aggregata]
MTEELKISLLQKLVSGNEIKKQLRTKKKDFINESIFKKNEDELKEYYSNGWELEREFKTKIRLKKLKTHDVLFEDKVWSLFASLGFKVLNRNRKLEIPYDKNNPNLTQQIDVLAKDDESLILIECKSTKEKNKKGDFKKELEAYKSKIEGIRNSLKVIFPDQKLKFRFVFATENYAISDNDLQRLENINGLHFDEEQIDYYSKMLTQIGIASKYQLLGNLFYDQEIPELDNKIPAIKGKMGGHIYYSFSIEPEKLLKIGYVLHRNKANINMMPTYQRIIKRARLKSIHNFIDEEKGYFPNSIIISLDSGKQNELRFEPANTQSKSSISKIGILHLPKRYRSAFIIDGQHRLYGYSNSMYKSSNSIPVVAFLNLDREEQVKLFMQINENQKAVSKNLRTTLDADLKWTSDSYTDQIQALCARIAIYLGEVRKSALFDKISIGEDSKIVTQATIINAIKKSNLIGKVTKSKIEELGTFYNGDLDSTYDKLSKLLSLIFNYVKDSLPELWEAENNIVVMNKGIYGIIRLQSDIIDFLLEQKIIKNTNNPNKVFEESKTYLDPIITFYENLDEETELALRKAYGSNGDIKYWRTLQQEISEVHEEFKPQGLEEYNKKEAKEFNTKAFEIIRDLETFFKKDFQEKLELKFEKSWFKKGVPPQVAKKANEIAFEKNLKIENEEDEVDVWDCLTIIAYRAIALKNWRDIFEKHYTKPTEEKISGGKDAKTQWMVKLEKLRNENFHQYSVTEDEFSFLEELHDWLIKK